MTAGWVISRCFTCGKVEIAVIRFAISHAYLAAAWTDLYVKAEYSVVVKLRRVNWQNLCNDQIFTTLHIKADNYSMNST